MNDRIETAIKHAREDAEELRQGIASGMGPAGHFDAEPTGLIVDGSMLSPSWRALAGGAAVYDATDWFDPRQVDAIEAYEETLDRLTDDMGLYWEDGCLWRAESVSEDDTAAIDQALEDCQLWDNLPESAKDYYRRAAKEDSENPV